MLRPALASAFVVAVVSEPGRLCHTVPAAVPGHAMPNFQAPGSHFHSSAYHVSVPCPCTRLCSCVKTCLPQDQPECDRRDRDWSFMGLWTCDSGAHAAASALLMQQP